MPYALPFVLLALLLAPRSASAQGSVVAPGPHHTLRVDGAPFFPRGWTSCGTCTASYPSPEAFTFNRDSVVAHLETMRRHGTNTVLEYAFADGRILAQGAHPGWFNWYGYGSFRGDPSHTAGHPRPGVYAEGMRWLMDRAVAPPPGAPARKIYTVVSLSAFVTPGHAPLPGLPYGGDDTLSCGAYRAFIEQERAQNRRFTYDPDVAARIPAVDCTAGTARRMPFWEWNLWYVVRSLRDHPGLLGWFLWDEPEGVSYRHLFGIVPRDQRPRAYRGPASLPTPDLLRYVYHRIRTFEAEGRPAGYRPHPVLVDIASPNAFFSDRFGWSSEGHLDPRWSSGPFDRTPGGGYHTPADILGEEASASMAHTDPDYYHGWDQNFVSRHAAMLMDVVRRDSLWTGIVAAAQAQLPDQGPYRIAEPLRCSPNPERTRLLNDRDLTWQLLTAVIDGLRGYVYYSHALMPATGAGAAQVRRSHRLLRQFEEAGLPTVLQTPARTAGWSVTAVSIRTLTDYFRSNPDFVGPAARYDARRGGDAAPDRVAYDAYRVARFGRAGEPHRYGQAVADPEPSTHPEHRLLRAVYHRAPDGDYLLLSNAFDARVEAEVRVDWPGRPRPDAPLSELHFDLEEGGAHRWSDYPARLTYGLDGDRRRTTLRIQLEPYEARVFRLRFSPE